MNCKPGDTARIVGGFVENKNRLVRVVGSAQLGPEVPDQGSYVWEVEALQSLVGMNWQLMRTVEVKAGEKLGIRDSELRPLYDGDGVDEMLRITGKPKVNAAYARIRDAKTFQWHYERMQEGNP